MDCNITGQENTTRYCQGGKKSKTEPYTNPENEKDPMTRATERMDENDLGQITRPTENATGELPHIPNEHLDPQDHEGK